LPLSSAPPQEVAVRLFPALFGASLLLAVAGCAGGGSSTLPNSGSTALCDAGAVSIQLARPTPGFPQTSANTIEIVSSTDTDQLHGSPNQFDLILVDQFSSINNGLVTGPLNLVPDPGGPHPYTNDFFYAGTISNGSLQFSRTYNVYLNAFNTQCTPGFVGSFST
jgi:hypothetical protein